MVDATFSHFLLTMVMIISSLNVAFHGASADYAPEKMDPDNEAYKEMNLEPRSSIPHPMNSVPVTPAAIQAKPLHTNQANTENTNKVIIQSPGTQQTANLTVGQKANDSGFINNNTAKQPELDVADVTSNTVPSTTSANQLKANETLSNNSFVPQPVNQQSNVVAQTEQAAASQPQLNTMSEGAQSIQNNDVAAPGINTKHAAAPESVSFGTPSTPLTPIKTVPDTEANDGTKVENDKQSSQQSSNTTLKPTTATAANVPVTMVTGSPAQLPTNKSTNIAEEPNENKELNVDQVNKPEVNKGSTPKADLDASGSGDDEEEEEPETPNIAPHNSENQKDKEDDDEDIDDDSGSGEEAQEDNAKPFLHDNHTLTSTNGAVKIGTKQTTKPIEDNTEEDSNMENAVEDALEKETNSEDEDEDEAQQEKLTNSQQQHTENLEDSKDIMEMEKHAEPKKDAHFQKPLQKSIQKTSEKSEDTEDHHQDVTKPSYDKVKPLQIPKTTERNPATKEHATEIKADKNETHKQAEPAQKELHNEIKAKTKTSPHEDLQQAKPLKPTAKTKVVLSESVTKPKKVFKKPLLKYIHRVASSATIANKTVPQKCSSDEIKKGYSLKGGTRAGHVNDLGGTASIHDCIKRCCNKKVCDVALLLDGRCFGVSCFSKELCAPIPVPHPHYVSSQIAFLNQVERRAEVEQTRPEFDCKYGELTIRNNHRWSGELCGGVVSCKNGIIHLEKCPDIPPKPKDCANPKLFVKQRPGQCCVKKWQCKDKSCMYGHRKIPHGVSLSDPLCTGVISCFNGHLKTTTCPDIPSTPTNCANPRLKIVTIPGKCCRRKWVCQDKSCTYNKLKIDHGERLTDASCSGIMECNNGYLHFKQCPSPPRIPHGCLNPRLMTKRVLGECCQMKWTCAADI